MADDIDDRETAPDRVLALAGDVLASLAPFGAGRDEWEAGLDELAPDATEAEIHEALSTGILRGLSWTEKRRALREYHDRAAEAGDEGALDPLVEVARVEDRVGGLIALHVLCSDPDVDVFRDEDSVLLVSPDGYEFRERIDVPFAPFRVDHEEADNVTEFYVRHQPVDAPVDDLEDADVAVHPDVDELTVEPFEWDEDDGGDEDASE